MRSKLSPRAVARYMAMVPVLLNAESGGAGGVVSSGAADETPHGYRVPSDGGVDPNGPSAPYGLGEDLLEILKQPSLPVDGETHLVTGLTCDEFNLQYGAALVAVSFDTAVTGFPGCNGNPGSDFFVRIWADVGDAPGSGDDTRVTGGPRVGDRPSSR